MNRRYWTQIEQAWLIFYLSHNLTYECIQKLLEQKNLGRDRSFEAVAQKASSIRSRYKLNDIHGEVDVSKTKILLAEYLENHQLSYHLAPDQSLDLKELEIIKGVLSFNS